MNDIKNSNQVPIANLSTNELDKITHLEKELNEKYFLIAFERDNNEAK